MRVKLASCLLLMTSAALCEVILKYHTDQLQWYFQSGIGQGTWFHVEDFMPGPAGFTVEWAELGLYYPTALLNSTMTVQIWNGGSEGPSEFLASQEIQVPQTLFIFDPPVDTAGDFWCILNDGGTPVGAYIAYDYTPQGHSFFTDDFVVWEGFTEGEFFISVGCSTFSLESCTWGGIKGSF